MAKPNESLGETQEIARDTAEVVDRFISAVGRFLNRQNPAALNTVDALCGILGSVPSLTRNPYITALRAACVAQGLARARAKRRK